MTAEVWCVIGEANGRAGLLAEALIEQGHSVAIPTRDVSSLAMLVNRRRDAVMPVEVEATDEVSLERMLHNIEDSYGDIDTFAIILDRHVEAEYVAAVKVLIERRADAVIVLVTGAPGADEPARAATRLRNTDLQAHLRASLPAPGSTPRPVFVREFSDVAMPDLAAACPAA